MNPTTGSLSSVAPLNDIHVLNHAAWIFDESTLKIVDANKQALEICRHERPDVIGLSITDLWHGKELDAILKDIDLYSAERSFFGDLKHRKKNGDIVVMRVRATRLLNEHASWVVHLVSKYEESKFRNQAL